MGSKRGENQLTVKKDYAQKGIYFLCLSPLESSVNLISPASEVSFSNREIIELFFESISKRSRRVVFVIYSLLTRFRHA